MPRRRVTAPTHAQARHRAQGAVVRDLVAGVVAEAQVAHAAALRNAAGSMRTFLREAALPAVWAANGAGALWLLPAMHRGLNAVRLGLVDPEAALYGLWM